MERRNSSSWVGGVEAWESPSTVPLFIVLRISRQTVGSMSVEASKPS